MRRVAAGAFCLWVLASSVSAQSSLTAATEALAQGREHDAVQLFQDAFEAGDAEAGYALARMLEQGRGTAPDLPEALKIYGLLAEAGHAAAENRLGVAYLRGDAGLVPDRDRAAALFERAAEAGDVNGLFNDGFLLVTGPDAADRARGLALLEGAARRDHVLALNVLAGIDQREGRTEQAQQRLARSAALGNAVGQFETGKAILGTADAPGDRIAALSDFILAAARGHAEARAARDALTGMMEPADVAAAQERATMFTAEIPAYLGAGE